MRFWFRRKTAPSVGVPMANFTLQAQLAGQSGRTMGIQGVIYEGESIESLNARLDALQAVIERQRTRCEIPELEARRDQMVKGMEQAREVLTELENRMKDGGTLSSQERANVNTMRVNIKKVSEEIKRGEEAIGEARRKAGVA